MNAASPQQTQRPTIDLQQYRQALSCFGTGVTVVTAHHDGQDWGMTCNSFTSVSLSPQLVLWSIRKEASSLQAFTQSGGFTVSVLAQDQASLAWQFASGPMPQRFANVPVHRQTTQRLRLSDCIAWFDCDMHQVIDAGDHLIVLGAVRDFDHRAGASLAFCRSQLASFEPLPD